jgi:hypothetical protein
MGEDIRFAHFIAVLALNPEELRRYQKDPEKAMQDAGLSDDEKGVLRTGDFRLICDLLDAGKRPITQDQGGPGSGSGTGQSGG